MNQKNAFSNIEIEQNTPIRNSVIWLHGLGADGSDFVPIIPELNLPSTLGIRFIFPHAPIIPVTISQGFEMRAWFDIYGIQLNSKIDFQGIQNSTNLIEQLIAKEIQRGIPSEHIILAGFSQGATMAMITGLFHAHSLAGIIALSGYLPIEEAALKKAPAANRNIPIFLAHGIEDNIVPYPLGKATYSFLKKFDYPISWHSYEMSHSVCKSEIHAIGQWIQSTLPL